MPIRQMTKKQILESENLLSQNYSKSYVAIKMRVTRTTLRKILKEYREFGDSAIDTTSIRLPKSGCKEKTPYQSKIIGAEFKRDSSIWETLLYSRVG